MKTIFISVTVFFLFVSPAIGEVVIIVNTNNPIVSISKGEMLRIYKMRKMFWDDKHIRILPVTLPSKAPTTKIFFSKYCEISSKKIFNYYLKRAIAGHGLAPKTLLTEREVTEYISYEEGAIGFVSEENITDSVKVIKFRD